MKVMGHCSCGAHSCAAEKKVDAKVSVFHEYGKVIFSLLLLTSGIIMNALDLAFFREGSVALIWYIVAYLPVGIPVMKEAWESIREKDYFSEFTLMIIATLGAFYIGEYPEGVAVMLFYTVGELFQDKAVDKAKRNIGALLDVRPEKALVLREGNLVIESPKKIKVGEIIEIKAGERVPLDGTMQNEVAAFNTAALTGESVPRNIRKGEEVLAGMIVTDKVIRLEVTRPFDKSALARILELVQNASERKAPAELFIRKFARIYTPIVIALAVLIVLCPFVYSLINPPFVFAFNDWLYRALVFLVISCPCALVVSIPLGYFGGIGAASRLGILFKGGNYLDAITKINTVVFDKTGTLTKGVFKVVDITVEFGFTKEQVLEYAAQAESYSNHPIAKSIQEAFGKTIDQSVLSGYEEISGHGIRVLIGGKRVLAGNSKLMDSEKVSYAACQSAGTKVYIAVDGRYAGCIVIADEVKDDSQNAIASLKKIGVEKTVMLTGDDEKIGKAVAEQLGLDEYYAQLLPDQKVEKLEYLDQHKTKGSKLAFIGDGINDAPVLARADVGIAMGGLGSDAAIEAADVVLMTDESSKLVDAIDVAKATKRIVMQNIIALGIKSVFLILGALGIAGMWEAVFGDVGVTIIAVLNAMRILKK
mgnify:CR=1 FL=1